MKITPNPAMVQALQTYNKNRVTTTKKSEEVVGAKDKMELSAKAMDFQTAMKALKGVPDIRQERVDEVKAKMAQGNLATPREVAEKMMNDINMKSRL